MTHDQTIKRALKILEARMRSAPTLASPEAVRDYLRLLLHDRAHEVFVCCIPRQPASGHRLRRAVPRHLGPDQRLSARGGQGGTGAQRRRGDLRPQPSERDR